MNFSARADLHVHSRHSDRPSEWLLRRVGAPECFTDPQTIYDRAKAAGMQFVTVTDHNAIAGALELKAKYPVEVFVSEEISAYFPENECKMHILAWDLTEAQHAELQKLRENIYELAPYLRAQGILHAVAHPFSQTNGKLTADQFEKLLLMFRHFEGLNASKDPLLNSLATDICRSLTPEIIRKLADRHGLAPFAPDAHVKILTGGSDDHSSAFIARGWTAVPQAATAREFLEAVRAGQCEAGGKHGSALTMAHSLYNIAYLYSSDKLSRGTSKSGHELMVKVFENFVAGRSPARITLGTRVKYAARKLFRKRKTAEERELSLSSQFSALLRQGSFQGLLERDLRGDEEVEVRSFKVASRLLNELSFIFAQKLVTRLTQGNIVDALQALSALAPIGLGAAPYIFGFKYHTKDRDLMREAGARLLGQAPAELTRRKRGWFTDTIRDVNGVSHTIQKISGVARRQGHDLEVLACCSGMEAADFPLRNFAPVGEFKLPEYELLTLSFPPILEILEHCWRQRFSDICVSTPGPMGLMGIAAARLLGLPASGIYHTDFPEYVRVLTKDEAMAALTWKYMEWFYGLLDRIYVPSGAYRNLLLDRGVPEHKLKIMPRGIDTAAYSPDKRDPHYWDLFGAGGRVRFLYAGRVSKEKDLDVLAAAFQKLHAEFPQAALAFVGDGPYLDELRRLLPRPATVFTGFLSGDVLCRAYASADVFVFPSTTDTFGNVVLEAQASGLPVIVSDKGGPRELVEHGETGLITQGRDADSLCDAMRKMVADPEARLRMGRTARARMSTRTWERAFEEFWE